MPGTGDNSHPKSYSSSSHRKSRWEQISAIATATATATTTATTPTSNLQAYTKPSVPGPNKTTKNPSPKPKTGLSPKPSTAIPLHVTPFRFPDLDPHPAPSYDFHMLERRIIALADGTVGSYFALPPDYQDFPPSMHHIHPFGSVPDFYESQIRRQNQIPSLKRKFEEDLMEGNCNNRNGDYLGFQGEFMAGTSRPFRRREAGG